MTTVLTAASHISSLVAVKQQCSLRRFQPKQVVQPWHTVQQPRVAESIAPPRAGNNFGGNEEVDLTVFRFTLGIPGFDDRYIPAVVGGLGLVLLAVNHLLGANPPPDPQVRAEALGALLCGAALVTPGLEERLAEADGARGRAAATERVAGSANAFALADGLADDAKAELAWASFALLKNTNTCSVLVWRGGRVVMARGALSAALAEGKAPRQVLEATTQAIEAALQRSSLLALAAAGSSGSTWLPDPAAMAAKGARAWDFVPQGVQSLLIQPLQPLPGGTTSSSAAGLLLLLAERPRALSSRERQWAAAVAAKLDAAITV